MALKFNGFRMQHVFFFFFFFNFNSMVKSIRISVKPMGSVTCGEDGLGAGIGLSCVALGEGSKDLNETYMSRNCQLH